MQRSQQMQAAVLVWLAAAVVQTALCEETTPIYDYAVSVSWWLDVHRGRASDR